MQYLFATGLSPTPAYVEGLGEERVKKDLRKQCEIFKTQLPDMVLAEVSISYWLTGMNIKFKLTIYWKIGAKVIRQDDSQYVHDEVQQNLTGPNIHGIPAITQWQPKEILWLDAA